MVELEEIQEQIQKLTAEVHRVSRSKNVTVAQVVTWGLLVAGAGLGFWSTTRTDIAVLKEQILNSKVNQTNIEIKVDKVNGKLDELNNGIIRLETLINNSKQTK